MHRIAGIALLILISNSLSLSMAVKAQSPAAVNAYNKGLEELRRERRSNALLWLSRACDLGHGEGCYWAGKISEHGRWGMSRPRSAARYYRQGCDRGHGESCADADRLSSYYPEGQPDWRPSRLPTALQNSLGRIADHFLRHDSCCFNWGFGTYSWDSARNVSLDSGSIISGNYSFTAHYTYAHGGVGWVRIRMVNGYLDCMIFHDAPHRCRPINQARGHPLPREDCDRLVTELVRQCERRNVRRSG